MGVEVLIAAIAGALVVCTFRRLCSAHAARRATLLVAVVNSSPSAILTTDLAGVVTSWNPGAEETFGWPANEMMGRDVEMLVPPEERHRVAGALARLGLTCESWWSEITARHREGQLIQCAIAISPVLERGKLAGMAVIATDVTERRRTEAALGHREHQLTEAQRAAHMGSWSWDVAADLVEWSDELFRIFGVDPARFDATRHTYLDLVHPDHRPMVERTIGEALADGDGYEFEHQVVREDGAVVWVAGRGVIERDEAGTPLTLTGTVQDITERRSADQARSRLAAIVDSSDDAMISSTLDGIISTWNRGAEKLIGYCAEEVLGRHASFLVPHDRQHEIPEIMEKIRAGEGVALETVRVRRDGSPIPVSITSSPIRDSQGSVVGSSGVARDITARKRLETQLSAARDEAIAASSAKSEFLTAMSHEIRTPMNGVIGMTGLLLDTELDREQREYAETVRSSAESLLIIINDILDFSKVEAGRVDLEIVDFDLGGIIEEVGDLLAEQAHGKGLELASVVARDVPTPLCGDPSRIRQVLTNLVGNAVKFTSAGEVVVRVGLEQQTDQAVIVRIEVADTGIGMPPEVRGRLFQPFSQADFSTTRTYGGTGLGLAISKQLVELMGGEIDVDSEPGGGSTFRLVLPLGKATAAAEAAAAPAAASVDLAGRRALVVDDNATVRAILVHHLASLGMVTTVADGGPAALSALAAAARHGEIPEVVLVDMAMPGMDGLALARAIRADRALARVQLLLLTSASAAGSAAAAREGGFAACLAKPVRQSQLLEAITMTVSGEAMSRPLARHTGEEPAGFAGPRVLVAEDNPVNQRLIALQLAKLGYRADVVANGSEAVEALSRIPYGAVLMDCQMPVMDGYEATAEVRRREEGPSRVPIIALTADVVAGARDRCLAAGMDDYVAKPFTLDNLAAVLKRWMPEGDEAPELVLAR